MTYSVPPPPVPEKLREMLKDYPDHIERLREALAWKFDRLFEATPVFEQALWTLEGRLEAFIHEATDELEAANASGDPVAIEAAKAKRSLMFQALSRGMSGLSELRAHCEKYQERF